MFDIRMKPVIDKAMNLRLKNISTYKGYKGAELLKLTFIVNDDLVHMRHWLKINKYDAVTKMNDCVELIVIFEIPKDENGEQEYYDLKYD